jgi:pyruvate,orthophosphate dikinase
MKEAVTAWQLRSDGGTQALNDHSDPAYDATVLDHVTALHEDVARWVSSMPKAPPRLDRYVERLARALALAQGGDHRFVASPKVDSYHGVWFELHEELIQLAGRTREEEAAAGRT